MPGTISIIIRGLVQGVHFRQTTREKAKRLGITGEVRNKADGTVHIIATGSPEQLEQLVQWCRQGPPNAVVSDVEVKELSLQQFESFTVERG